MDIYCIVVLESFLQTKINSCLENIVITSLFLQSLILRHYSKQNLFCLNKIIFYKLQCQAVSPVLFFNSKFFCLFFCLFLILNIQAIFKLLTWSSDETWRSCHYSSSRSWYKPVLKAETSVERRLVLVRWCLISDSQ